MAAGQASLAGGAETAGSATARSAKGRRHETKYKIIVEAVENETLALEKIRNKKDNSYELPFLFTFIIKKNFTPTMQSGSVSWNTAIRYCPGQRNHLP